MIAEMVKRSERGFTIVCYADDPKLFKNNMKKKYRNSIRIFKIYIISQIKGKKINQLYQEFLIVALFLTNKICYLLSTYCRSETL